MEHKGPMTYLPPRTKPARRAPPKAARAGAMVFSALARKTKYADPTLAENWPSIAGPIIGSLCRPGRILGSRQGGARSGRTLEVYTPSGAAAAELQMRLDDLMTRVNRFLGPGIIARITVIQAAGKAPGAAAIAGASGSLEQALASFRSAIANKSDTENGEK
jgi:hypothetical protein